MSSIGRSLTYAKILISTTELGLTDHGPYAY